MRRPERGGKARSAIPLHIAVTTLGDVPEEVVDYAREQIAFLVKRRSEPVSFAGLKLTFNPGDVRQRPALAQATLDVADRPVRAQVAGTTPRTAVDSLVGRLQEQLERLSGDRDEPWCGGGDDSRPEYVVRPPELRKIVRCKTYAVGSETPDEAAFELEIMDYGFHLFTDSETGQDSVIYRDAEGCFFLAQVTPTPLRTPPKVRLTASVNPAPRLTEDQARRLLEACGVSFVFFADSVGGRGRVLYRRFDGNYGLITPAEAETDGAAVTAG